MSDYIDEVFGTQGFLAAKFPGYSPRVGQVAMARTVDRAIRDRGHLLVEAGTGTGKSVAYAVPAIWHVRHPQSRFVVPAPPSPPDPTLREPDGVSAEKRSGGGAAPPRAILVTANIALQEQLFKKDLPLLAEVLPWKFSYALLKGVSNYLCLSRLNDEDYQSCDPDDRKSDAQIRAWAETTETGDKSELSFEPPAKLWSHFSVSSDECEGRDCEFYKQCHPRQAKKKATTADVIVTNYALFFLDLIVRERTNGEVGVIPPYTIAILDEGHKAVDIARDYYGFRITEGSIDWAGSMLPEANDKIELHRAQQKFFAGLREHKRSGNYKARIKKPDVAPAVELLELLSHAAKKYNQILDVISDEEPSAEERKRRQKIGQRLQRVYTLRAQIAAAMRLYALPESPWYPHPTAPPGNTPATRWYFSDPRSGGDNSVKSEAQLAVIKDIYFIEEDKNRMALCSMPISIADKLRDQLFGATDSVTVTSATLMAGGSFDFITSDFGVNKPTTLIAQSPFSWRDQALLVLPVDLPEPNAPSFTSIMIERLATTVELAQGRTLGLFTSYKNLNAAYDHLRRQTTYRVLRQGDMPRTVLINEFRKDVNSVLLGTESFWAGVDVQGESLSCVFIDRLPFATPDDPLLDALSEKERNWFMKYSIPQAIIAFKQGFGRLIRTTTDKGVVVVCDRRITTKGYGQMFIASLPSVQQSWDLGDVRRFLDGEPLKGTSIRGVSASTKSLFDSSF